MLSKDSEPLQRYLDRDCYGMQNFSDAVSVAVTLHRLLGLSFSLLLLPVTLGVDLAGEGILKGQGNLVANIDHDTQEQSVAVLGVSGTRTRITGLRSPCRTLIEQRSADEAASAPPVHGSIRDVEWEARDGRIHQDAKVVTQIGAHNAELPHAGQHERVANGEQAIGRRLRQRRGVQGRRDGLAFNRRLVAVGWPLSAWH